MKAPILGEIYFIDGFKAFIISGNKEADIKTFAKVNNISEKEASEIFANIPALNNFEKYIITSEETENIVITDEELEDNENFFKETGNSSLLTAANTSNNTNNVPSINAVIVNIIIPIIFCTPYSLCIHIYFCYIVLVLL